MKTRQLNKTLAIFLLLFVTGNCIRAQKKLLRLDTVTFLGVTDTVDMMPILINTDGNVIVAGNQKMNATQYDATIIKPLNTATSAWINQYNTSTQKAFITASCKDNVGNIITVGAIRENAVNGLDFLVIKVDNHGNQLWVYKYNGTNSTNDVASAVCVDNIGNIYVTGASDGSGFTLIDYATIKLSPSGNPLWPTASRYDNMNNMDIPTGISYDNASACVYVTGSSGVAFTDYDFLTVKYRAANGVMVDKARITNNTGAGQDQTTGLISDTQGNLYITGTTYNGSDYDLQVAKLDTAMNQIWVKRYNGYNHDDAGIGIALDGNSNIVVTGSSYKNNGTRELIVLKYDSNGNLLWTFKRQPESGQDAEGLRVQVTPNHEYFIGANYGTGINQDIVLLCLDANGRVQLEVPYDSGFRDRFMDLKVDQSSIYISGRSMGSGSSNLENNIAIKYSYKNYNNNIAVNNNGGKYVSNEVIISFDKSVMNMNTVNNTSYTFGNLSDFISGSTCSKMTTAFDKKNIKQDARNLSVRKIYFDLTEADSLSLSRTGDYVKVPAFYTSLVISLPSNMNAIDVTNILSDNINLKPDIRYAQLNHVFELAAPPTSTVPPTNDMFFPDQANLHPTALYPFAHCNVDSAWATTTGTPSIKVGVLDSGIQPGHEDLSASFQGFDFTTNSALANGDSFNHGTPIAGIIGATRNNNVGVSGIAGGDASTNQTGATMYDCTVCDYGICNESWCAPALLKSSRGTNIGGYGLHILSCSWYLDEAYLSRTWGHGFLQLTVDQLNFASRNGVVLAFAKGNNPLGNNAFPADWSDEMILSVGSNGKNGEHCNVNKNCSNSSTTWGEIDLVAPGTAHIVMTTNSTLQYVNKGGTSMATPHVSGAAALMMGYFNKPYADWNNLVHEDVEHILQRTATDLDSISNYEKPGYDTTTGWGRLNVYRAMKGLDKNYYRIHHITETIGNISTSAPTTNLVFTDTMTWKNYTGVQTGVYMTEVYKRTVVINYALLPTEQIIDKWALTKECYGTRYLQRFDGDRYNYSVVDSITPTTCTLSTYYYKIPSLSVYAPFDPSQIRSAFTVYTYDETGTVGIKDEKIVNYRNIKIFPNPTSGLCTVNFGADADERLNYKLFNIVGQEVKSGTYSSRFGKNELQINIGDLTNGVYILSILDMDSKPVFKKKIIKTTD